MTRLAAAVFALFAVHTSAMALCTTDPKAGIWLNRDASTRSITRVDYVQFCNDTVGVPCDETGCHPPAPNPNIGKIRLYGSCSPSDCDWGWTNVVSSTIWAKGNYDQGFAKRTVFARFDNAGGFLELVTRSDFTDARPDREDRDYFRRANVSVSVENNTDRPGQDYTNFNTSNNANDCRQACLGDVQCAAFTWVPPGVQGPSARCWLKSGVPGTSSRSGMVSGVKSVL